MDLVTYSRGPRGGSLIHGKSYIYRKHSVKNNITRWRCINRGCPGAIYLDEEGTTINTKEHTCNKKFSKFKVVVIFILIIILAYIIKNLVENVDIYFDITLKEKIKFK